MKRVNKALILVLVVLFLSLALAACSCSGNTPKTNSYTVTFNTDGGSTVSSQTVDEGGKAVRPSQDPTKTGYTFDNWYKDSAKTDLFDFSIETINANTTIYAKWNESIVRFTVSFDTDGGSSVASQTINKGGKVIRPSQDPTKTDFYFDNWYKNPAKTVLFDFTSETINSDTTIYAKWSSEEITEFTVSFDTDGGSSEPSQTIDKGQNAARPKTNPTKSGYTFDNWYKDSAKTVLFNFDTETINSHIIIYAKWNKNAAVYTVSFNVDGGSSVPSQSIEEGGKATRPTNNPTKTGYTFDNWYKNSAKTVLFDFNNETINSHTTIYAKWNDVTANSFQVTFNTDGGSTVPSQTINGGGKATRPMNNPTKDNYDFDNWYKDADKTIPFDFDSETIEATITIYAGWIVKSTQSTSFQWSTNKGTITIDSFIGSETEVKIPQTIDGKEVTAIAEWAFPECGVISITIPNSVTSIGYGAFAGCFGLTSINVGTSNGYYSSVDGILFSKTKTELILYPEGKTAISYAIPSTVTSIGDLAFFGCINLESITIPDSVISIGYEAFNYCRSLTSITIPDDVTSIGDYAFYNCSSLASVTIGSGITSIGEGAFYYCKSLISITIPNSVTSIGYGAFYYCESLTSITIPNSVTNIGRYAFSTCDSLTNVTFENTSGWYVTTTEGAVSGTNVTTTNASTNATYLKSTYYSYYWYRK